MDATTPPTTPQVIAQGIDLFEYLKPQSFFLVVPAFGDKEYVEITIDDGSMKLNALSTHPSLLDAITESQRLNRSGRRTNVLEFRAQASFTGHTFYVSPNYSPLKDDGNL